MSLILVVAGLAAILFGMYGVLRVTHVKARSKRPELAPMLYMQCGLMVVVGAILVIEGLVLA